MRHGVVPAGSGQSDPSKPLAIVAAAPYAYGFDMPEKPTLVIVDMQKAFDDPAWGERNNPGAEGNVARLLAAWRAADAPVIHVRHRETDPEWHFFNEGDPGFEFKPEAMPLADEPVLTKGVNSAFIGTDLEERLRAAGATTVVIAALTTDHCGSTTARMSGNLGFETWVVGDACATFDREGPDGEVFPADLIHRVSLASLHNEFAAVVSTDQAIARLLS
jgi:nicotinamidase-related amidase